MGCPLKGSCHLFNSCSTGKDKYAIAHTFCDTRNNWQGCPAYSITDSSSGDYSETLNDPIEVAKEEDRNMKIGIVIGVSIGLIFGFLYGEVLIGFIAGAIYGIGFSSIIVTIKPIQEFVGNLFGDSLGCILSFLLYVFVLPFLVGYLITTIVGIIRYFKRRPLLTQSN